MQNIYYLKNFKLALIGGLGGGMSYDLIPYILSPFEKHISLVIQLIMSGIIFAAIGLSIVFSLTLLSPLLKNNTLYIGGSIGGFVSGLFFPLGIGMYVALIFFPVSLAITAKLAGLKDLGQKIAIGGIIGVIFGVVASTLLAIGTFLVIQPFIPSNLKEIYYDVLAMVLISVSLYFLNLGVLTGVSQWKGKIKE